MAFPGTALAALSQGPMLSCIKIPGTQMMNQKVPCEQRVLLVLQPVLSGVADVEANQLCSVF